MLRFQDFVNLTEAKQEETGEQKLAIITFGRFNPPTRGHKKLVDAVQTIAEDRGGDAFIFPSPSYDQKKNPLPFEQKVAFMRAVFPTARIVAKDEIKNPFQAVGYLSDLGYTDIVLVVGSDRVDEFRRRFDKSYEFFDSFEVVSAGERDPDKEGISGMSGTKAREAAISGDVGKFRAATGWEGDIAYKMMQAVRAGMGID